MATDLPASGDRSGSREAPIGLKERFGYALGDFGSNMVFQSVSVFLLIYYTDVFGIGAATVGAILLFNRSWDGIASLLMGWLSDRTQSRHGSYRPYLLYGAVPFGVTLILVFAGPPLPAAYKVAYAFITLFLLEGFYDVVNIPYAAMIPVISRRLDNRAALGSSRFVGTMIATLLVAGAGPGILKAFTDQQTGYRIVTFALAAIGIASLFGCFALLRERYPVEPEERVKLSGIVPVLRVNWPLWVLLGSVVVLFIGFTMRNGTALYYFKYNIGHSELAGAFLGLQGLFGIAGALSATFLARRFDKRATMSIGMGIFALASLVNFVAGDSLPVAIANGALGGFGLVLAAAMVFAMVADCVDFAEGRSGIKAAGIAAALITAGTKFSTAVGGAIVGFALAAAGYVANQQQNAGSLTAIRDLITIVPAAFAVVAIAIIWFYPLSAARMVGVQRDLSA